MFAFLLLRLRYRAYLRHEQGIKKFAEMNMGRLIRKVAKKSAVYRKMNENLLVEKSNLRLHRDELQKQATLDTGQFFSIGRRLWGSTALVVLFLMAGVAINVVAAHDFIGAGLGLGNVLRWIAATLIALVLTGGGMIVMEQLIDTYMHDQNDAFLPPSLAQHRGALILLWVVLLACLELATIGLTEVEARAVAGDASLLYLSIIVGAAVFPITAGAFRWYTLQYIDRYKVAVTLRQTESRIAQIDSILRQNEESESNFYKMYSIEHWEELNAFRTLKENINYRHDLEELLTGHYAFSYDLFQAEAQKRYAMDIRDTTAASMRKLDLADQRVGNKVGQSDRQPAARPAPPATPRPVAITPPPTETKSDDLFALKPIR